MSTSRATGEAFDAAVERDREPVTDVVQAHLDAVADAAEEAVGNVEQMIKHLQESLEDRRAEAQNARREAEQARGELA